MLSATVVADFDCANRVLGITLAYGMALRLFLMRRFRAGYLYHSFHACIAAQSGGSLDMGEAVGVNGQKGEGGSDPALSTSSI
jgi:hypothetical protein